MSDPFSTLLINLRFLFYPQQHRCYYSNLIRNHALRIGSKLLSLLPISHKQQSLDIERNVW